MDRRMRGALLLAIVLLAAVVLPNLSAKAIRGIAVPAPIPGPPRLGECLLETPAPYGDSVPGQSYRLGSCANPHYGEVAQVVTAAAAPAPTDTFATSASSCTDESGYLGWAPPATADIAGLRWQPISTGLVVLVPTPVQQAFGQSWVVCVVTPANDPNASYTGSVRGALAATGRLPAVFAQCRANEVQLLAPPTACDGPHGIELFGTAQLSIRYRNQSALDTACRAIVQFSTRMTDPTAAGSLVVKAEAVHWDAAGEPAPGFADSASDLGAEAVCTVQAAGTRRLDGSLFGIGDRPVPWA